MNQRMVELATSILVLIKFSVNIRNLITQKTRR
jgi:hypothetical protein